MRRCYRSVALALGAVLLASNTFSNSCSLSAFGVYAAEDTLANEESKDTILLKKDGSEKSLKEDASPKRPDFSALATEIQTGEENVETEIPAEGSESNHELVENDEKTSINLDYNEYNVLLKIVEAEAGGEDLTGKMLVANVILNRVNSDRFPNTVTEVVYQKHNGSAQFSPTVDGRIDTVSISQETLEAVERVLNGEDHSNGALYFRSVRCNSTWFDNSLTRVVEHGNHIFYTI